MRRQYAFLAAGCLTVGLMAVLGSAQMDKASRPRPPATLCVWIGKRRGRPWTFRRCNGLRFPEAIKARPALQPERLFYLAAGLARNRYPRNFAEVAPCRDRRALRPR